MITSFKFDAAFIFSTTSNPRLASHSRSSLFVALAGDISLNGMNDSFLDFVTIGSSCLIEPAARFLAAEYSPSVFTSSNAFQDIRHSPLSSTLSLYGIVSGILLIILAFAVTSSPNSPFPLVNAF